VIGAARVRELLLGPKRFTDLKAGILKASPNVLAQRLRKLERAGVTGSRLVEGRP
jgi:DNA-binding HxlR family transcriptional regulator